MKTAADPMKVVLCAGEASGDNLGAGLIQALKQHIPSLSFAGIGGPKMAALGMDCWHDVSELSVMGLAEVVRHLPRLLRLRQQFYQRVLDQQPTLYIGIDAPDFNLPISTRLKQAGLATVHYVSPSVWAWRSQRIHKIAQACDHLLCLFPFEPAYYEETGLSCSFCGHPRADEIPLSDQAESARKSIGISPSDPDRLLLALLPGSRNSERKRLSQCFFAAARELQQRLPQRRIHLLSAQPNHTGTAQVQNAHREHAPELPLLFTDTVDTTLAACDLVLAASGTVTLEAMLYHRPQVAAYRLNQLTYAWVKHFKLMQSPWLTLPNVLAQQKLIPEIFQTEATPARLATELQNWLINIDKIQSYQQRAISIHQQLRLGAHAQAAQIISQILSTATN